MSNNSGLVTAKEWTEIQKKGQLLETAQDLKALRALSLYGRRLPLPLIQESLGVKRAQAYNLIKRGREVVGIEEHDVIPKTILLMDDLIRDAFVQIQDLEQNPTDEDGKPLSKPAVNAAKNAVKAQINSFVMTQLQAAKLALTPTGITTTAAIISLKEGVAMRLKEEPKSVKQLMEEIERESSQRKASGETQGT